jgi:hypothetical protein
MKSFSFTAKLWIYPGQAAWHFITLPKKESATVKEKHGKGARGFGSLPVEAKIGKTIWKTSIFPDSKSGTYLLPVKAAVRKKEEIEEGEPVSVKLTVRN